MTRRAPPEDVLDLLRSFGDIWTCIDGGWGVDALLGRETRAHSDLDLIHRSTDRDAIEARISGLGFERATAEDGIVYAKGDLHVDLHAVRFDEHGFGHFPLPDNGTWPFPPGAFEGIGRIGGQPVRCLSVDAQVHCHTQGYPLTPKDRADLLALQDRFGCVLPLSFYTTCNEVTVF